MQTYGTMSSEKGKLSYSSAAKPRSRIGRAGAHYRAGSVLLLKEGQSREHPGLNEISMKESESSKVEKVLCL